MWLFQDVSFGFSFDLWSRSLFLSELFLSNPIHGSWLNKNKSISQFILMAVIYKCSIIWRFNLNQLKITLEIICWLFVEICLCICGGVLNTRWHSHKYHLVVYVRKKLVMLLRVVTSSHSLNPPSSWFFCTCKPGAVR